MKKLLIATVLITTIIACSSDEKPPQSSLIIKGDTAKNAIIYDKRKFRDEIVPVNAFGDTILQLIRLENSSVTFTPELSTNIYINGEYYFEYRVVERQPVVSFSSWNIVPYSIESHVSYQGQGWSWSRQTLDIRFEEKITEDICNIEFAKATKFLDSLKLVKRKVDVLQKYINSRK